LYDHIRSNLFNPEESAAHALKGTGFSPSVKISEKIAALAAEGISTK
jgi:hypothetical protein